MVPGLLRSEMPKKIGTVNAFIAAAPKAIRPRLRELRAAIRRAAPKAKETISYRIPYYSYLGRLAYFGYHRAHIGLYLPGDVVARYPKDLKGYYSKGATVRFPLDEKVPGKLVQKLIKARLKMLEVKKNRKA